METSVPVLKELAAASLANHIAACFSEAEQAKQNVTERLLACERQRKGEYDGKTKALIAASGAQEIFMMLTDIKCRAADAWIKDVMMNHSESTWAMTPSAEPSIPPEIEQEIAQVVMQEAATLAAQGIMVDTQTMSQREKEVRDDVAARVKEVALERCKRMETRITDKLQEGNYRSVLSQLVYDFTTYPNCIIKGPVLRRKNKMRWGPDFQPIVEETIVMEVDRVSPYDIYPSPAAVSCQDGYLIHRHRLSRKAMRQMRDLPGADKATIKELLLRFRNGYKTTLRGDSERDTLNEREMTHSPDGLIEALEYWGPATGWMLKEWGIVKYGDLKIEEDDEYQINAWTVAGIVIRAVINPDPLGRRPYSKSAFEERPGSFWGTALPEMMADVQTVCNAAARALVMNMGIASGPQVEVNVDRLPPGTPITSMYPWKLWTTTTDRTGGGQPAIRFFQPDMKAAELMTIYQTFSRIADEVTGVPNYIYGSSNVSGAGRTASGLAMLMENAAKGIKHAILGLDAATSEVIERFYQHLMIHDPDVSIKGDMNIVAAGAIGAMVREQQQIARKEFMAATMNPIDAQIIGPMGRAHMLREAARGIFPDVDKIIPDPMKMQAMMAAASQPPADPAMGPTGQPAEPAALPA